jgi:hypothetical protein
MRPEFVGSGCRLEHLRTGLLLRSQVPRGRGGLLVPGEKHDSGQVAADLPEVREARVEEVVVADAFRSKLIDACGLRRLSEKVAVVMGPENDPDVGAHAFERCPRGLAER